MSDMLVAGVLLSVWAIMEFTPRFRSLAERAVDRVRGPGPSPVEQLQSEYVDGDLTEAEFEQRLDLALDERAGVIRQEVEAVDGVGPERSALLADRFESVEAIRRAEILDLTAVDGIGESTAADIVQHFE